MKLKLERSQAQQAVSVSLFRTVQLSNLKLVYAAVVFSVVFETCLELCFKKG